MLELEGKIVCAGDVLEALRTDESCPGRTKNLVWKYLERALRKAPFHHHQIDVNEMVCMFPDSMDIHVHMRYADKEFTEAHWDEDAAGSIWKGSDRLDGITRYPIGDCVVESGSVFIPAKYGVKCNYDVSFVAFEPFYSEKLRRKLAEEDGAENERSFRGRIDNDGHSDQHQAEVVRPDLFREKDGRDQADEAEAHQ